MSKVSGPDCTPAVVLESFEPELFYIIAELSYIIAKILNVCLKKFFFSHFWLVLSVVSKFKNVWERSIVKNFGHVCLLSVVSKVFEKLVKASQ